MSPLANTGIVLGMIACLAGIATIIARAVDSVTARERAGCPHCRRMTG